MGAIWNAVVLVADITQKNVTAVSRHQNAAAGQTAGREVRAGTPNLAPDTASSRS